MRKLHYNSLLVFLMLHVLFPFGHGKLCASEAKAKRAGNESLPFEGEGAGELLSIIEEESRKALDSKIIADFVPGIITVLRGDDLEERGIRTVYEALSLVPGLDLSMYASGLKKIVVRGMSGVLGLTDLKLLLNDVPVNNTNIGTTPGFFDIPVALVERVDIIRGSGAVIYGENASSGVINVITRNKGNSIYGRFGRYDTYEGGGVFSYENPETDFRMSFVVSGWDTDGADVNCEHADFTEEGGPTNESHQNGTAVMKVEFGDTSVLAQYLSVRFGEYFGYAPSLSGTDDDGKSQSMDSLFLEARHKINIGGDAEVTAKMGLALFDQNFRDINYTDGYVLNEDVAYRYDERRAYGKVDYLWSGWEKHRLTLGASYSLNFRRRLNKYITFWNNAL